MTNSSIFFIVLALYFCLGINMNRNSRENFYSELSFFRFCFLKPHFLRFVVVALLAACTPKTAPDQKGTAESPKNEENAGSYHPRISPLPTRTPKPLEEWGIDNGETIISHTFSAFSDPMYPPDFTHFDYVNPDAPQGGTLRLSEFGTFDSFNPYAQRGDNAAYTGDPYLYDTLMVPSSDEIDAYYPLIAEKVEYAKDFSYVIFHIDPRARFWDGQPITAEDVVFSFAKFMEQGVPQFARYFADVSDVRATSERLRCALTWPNPAAR